MLINNIIYVQSIKPINFLINTTLSINYLIHYLTLKLNKINIEIMDY